MLKINQILKDFSLIYKNFITWNVIKLMIFLASLLLVFISILPIFFLWYIVSLYDKINWFKIYELILNSESWINNSQVLNIFFENKIFSLIYIFLIVLFIWTIIISYNYSNFVLFKFYIKYIRGEKNFNLKENFFNFNYIKKYFLITINFVLYLFLPIIFFIAWYFIILFIFPDSEKSSRVFSNFLIQDEFSFWLVSLSFISIFYFFYLIYRLIFSYVILADDENYLDKLKYPFYIKESLRLTKSLKYFFVFAFLTIILFFIFSPILKIWDNIKQNLITNIELLNVKERIIPFLSWKKVQNKKIIIEKKEEIRKNTQKNLILYIFYLLVYFLLILWIFNLLVVSFYERFLVINRISFLKEKYKSWNFLIKKKIKVVKK
jgi:hypothetical protein